MAKQTVVYACRECGACFPKWMGQCSACEQWNTLTEQVQITPIKNQNVAHSRRFIKPDEAGVTLLSAIEASEYPRFSTRLSELDRVLGGGIVAGSVILMGGDPGIGKSTLLLQTLCHLSRKETCLYVTGEESLQQVKLRAQRLNLQENPLHLLSETSVEKIIQTAQRLSPRVIVIDSIQTIHTEWLPSAPGSVGQVRESAAQLVQFAKQTHTALFLVGHVTKEGALAGPRVLEHMVDTVLYFEGERADRFRLLRAVKNRFGAVNELGVFAMMEEGLRQVSNPSALFLSHYQNAVPGSVITVAWEGSRPLLVEVQALVNENPFGNPRRLAVGFEQNRLSMLLAVLQRHGRVSIYNQDVFLNVVGGMRVSETSVDLALLLAVHSSWKNESLYSQAVVFGEVGLAGEIRPVQNGQERLLEAQKHGFERAIVPKANKIKKQGIKHMEILEVETLNQVLEGLHYSSSLRGA